MRKINNPPANRSQNEFEWRKEISITLLDRIFRVDWWHQTKIAHFKSNSVPLETFFSISIRMRKKTKAKFSDQKIIEFTRKMWKKVKATIIGSGHLVYAMFGTHSFSNEAEVREHRKSAEIVIWWRSSDCAPRNTIIYYNYVVFHSLQSLSQKPNCDIHICW